ncbi:hypothetical protein [Rubinisphaera italica]|uniref:Uncharacterized protein n=1 Tax=Rubinisphaera italica TaxID=2527969 RepID=A0A5C5XFB2_9PLAN|nr:hypothetical protein [Rubinisphaera italica]TWT60835.1 hypothetical protein Pan54_15620 [Rubinisphaera italica]
MTEQEKDQILKLFKECIVANPDLEFGPIIEDDSCEYKGIWIQVAGYQAYLGASYQAAMLTAQLSDWWIPSRDGNLLDDDREWFETRAMIGNDWEQQELRMFKQERRTRLALNIGLATRGDLKDEREN